MTYNEVQDCGEPCLYYNNPKETRVCLIKTDNNINKKIDLNLIEKALI